jgi:hypothetical protein
MGNAILIRQIGSTRGWPNYPHGIVPIWLIETDFGNRVRFTEPELDTYFTRGKMVTYQDWYNEREELRNQIKILNLNQEEELPCPDPSA